MGQAKHPLPPIRLHGLRSDDSAFNCAFLAVEDGCETWFSFINLIVAPCIS